MRQHITKVTYTCCSLLAIIDCGFLPFLYSTKSQISNLATDILQLLSAINNYTVY